MVKQIDAERQAFREAPGTTHPRPSSPKITIAAPSNPYFPVEEIYVPHQSSNDSRSDTFDDPDVWRPPARVEIPSQYGSRRPTRAGQLAAAAQAKRMAAYARGAGGEKAAPTVGRGNKVTPSTGSSKSGIGAGPGMGNTAGKSSSSLSGNTGARKTTNARSTPSKRESMVSSDLGLGFVIFLLLLLLFMSLQGLTMRGALATSGSMINCFFHVKVVCSNTDSVEWSVCSTTVCGTDPVAKICLV